MTDFETLGDRCKQLEEIGASMPVLMPGLPVVARLDGRAFHTFTRGLKRPYDERLTKLMVMTTKYLMDEFHALVGYTQSDEISLLWAYPTLFGGRTTKLSSVLASTAGAYFNKALPLLIPEKANRTPAFDARVFSCTSRESAVGVFVWRERDATKNSVAMAAQSMFSHKELQGKHRRDMMDMMMSQGVNWNDFPPFFKRGTYVRWKTVSLPYTAAEIESLPDKHQARKDPNLRVERRSLDDSEVPPLATLADPVEFLFGG